MNTRAEVLLTADEPGPFELIRPTGVCPIVIVCDHASNRIPQRLDNLGLSEEQLSSHIAWDPGAAELARSLSSRLDAALVLSNYSRLVIDCNRNPGKADSIATISDGIVIRGNSNLTELERRRRQRTLFDPYQQAIASIVSRRDRDHVRLLSIHSFTPVLDGQQRPWSIGVCYEKSEDWGRRMLMGLKSRLNPDEDPVGDNQPYDVSADIDYTIPFHGDRLGIPSLMLELRQDKLSDDLQLKRWCNIIAGCCEYAG